MSSPPSIPMDQEEEDDDDFYSARETQKKGSADKMSSPTVTPLKSDRDGRNDSTPSSRKSSSGKSDRQKDEKVHQGSDKSTKKSENMQRMLKDRNRWDMREYKKEELEPIEKPKKKKKKKKSKTKKRAETGEVKEKSKTDEESEENDENEPGMTWDRVDPQPRPFFQSTHLILKVSMDKPIAPKCKFSTLRFARAQEVLEYDAEGAQHLLGHYNERAISNPWRRWGAHRALCDQGGYLVDKNKKIVPIKLGSDPPPCPPNPRQVTLNKNCDVPDSQTMMGTIRVEAGPAETEVHRIGRVMEEYVLKNGGFVPPTIMKKEGTVQKQTKRGGRPVVVVVQTKGGNQQKDASGAKGKTPNRPIQVQKTAKPKTKKKKSGSESESVTEDDSTAEKGRKSKEFNDDSKMGGRFAFFKRSKQPTNKGKDTRRNNKGSTR